MPVIAEDAVVLLTRSNTDNKKFGSGFIIAEDEQYSYVVSCAHVVEDVGNKPYIAGLPAKILAIDSSDGLDMALLQVAKLNKSCLNQFALGIAETDIAISGYSCFEERQVKREIKGKLGKAIKLTKKNQSEEIAAFDIIILDDDFSKLAGGYSGSPLCNQAGRVIGVVTHLRTAERGHALCISNLKTLYADIDKLIPSFKSMGENARLTNIRSGLFTRMGKITIIFQALIKRLMQIEKEANNDDNEIFLTVCESFLNNEINASDFIAYYQSQTTAIPTNKHFVYSRLAEDLRDGKIVLCLGLELNSKTSLSRQIAALTDLNDGHLHALSEVCEYAELSENCRRSKLLSTLGKTLTTDTSNVVSPIYKLLGILDKPFLVIATGFDTQLFEHLQLCGKRVVTILTDPSTQKEEERYQLNFAYQRYETCSEEQLSTKQLMEDGYSIIYYPRGYLQPDQDMLLLSERDYFNASDLLNKRYPAYLHNKIKMRSLWFLGHHPDSWETRLLALGLQHQRKLNREKPLVIQPQADTFSELFWNSVGMICEHDNKLSLDEFVSIESEVDKAT